MLRLACGVALVVSMGAFGCGDGGGADPPAVVEPGATCIAFCVKAGGVCDIENFKSETCAQDCEEIVLFERTRSEDCGDAFEAALQCATPLDCQDIRDQVDQVNLESYPCLPELLARDMACPDT